MPTQRYGFDTCIVNGKIYAIGGEIEEFGNLSLSTVEMYDPKTDTWERRADMPTAPHQCICLGCRRENICYWWNSAKEI